MELFPSFGASDCIFSVCRMFLIPIEGSPKLMSSFGSLRLSIASVSFSFSISVDSSVDECSALSTSSGRISSNVSFIIFSVDDADSVDLFMGLGTFGLSSVIRISSGFVISFIFIPCGGFSSSMVLTVVVDVEENISGLMFGRSVVFVGFECNPSTAFDVSFELPKGTFSKKKNIHI